MEIEHRELEEEKGKEVRKKRKEESNCTAIRESKALQIAVKVNIGLYQKAECNSW